MDKHGYSLDNINVEGKSTRNAEYYGWSQIYKYSNTKSKASNLWNSIKDSFLNKNEVHNYICISFYFLLFPVQTKR